MLANSFYEAVTDQFTTSNLANDKPGYYLGMVREANGKVFRLAKANATVAINKAVAIDYTEATAANLGHTVVPQATASAGCAGVAEIAVTSGNYFWMTIGKIALTLVTGTVTAGDRLATSATSGALITIAAQTAYQVVGIACEANASGTNAKKVHLLIGF